MVAYVLGYLAQSVPIPLIATGGVDAATTFTLRAVGMPIEVALLGVVAHRVFAFWLPVIPGVWSATVPCGRSCLLAAERISGPRPGARSERDRHRHHAGHEQVARVGLETVDVDLVVTDAAQHVSQHQLRFDASDR